MGHSYALPRGPRVRLRLPRRGDLPHLQDLWGRQGEQPTELELARLIHFDPRGRVAICATALLGGRETVVGVGTISLQSLHSGIEQLVVDTALTEGLDELLRGALEGRAEAIIRSRAA